MEKRDFDTFKQCLREWMENRIGEYDAFVTGMNRRDDFGYQTKAMIKWMMKTCDASNGQLSNGGKDQRAPR
jgi:hypothetical protein